MKRLLFLLTFVYSVYLHAQQLMYQKTYGTALQDGCLWSEPTNDGGTILAGYTVVSSYWNMELVKLSSTGVIQWSATYGASYDDYAICVRQTTDNGFIAIGTNNIQDIILFKTDANGILQWSKTLGGIGVDRGFEVQQTTDGGYAITANSNSFSNLGLWLIKTDSLGNVQWTKTYTGNRGCYLAGAKQTPDNGFILTTQIRDSLVVDIRDVLVIKTNSIGDTIWTRIIGGAGDEEPMDIDITSDGGYVITGRTSSFGAGSTDIFLTRLDAAGAIQWTKTYGGSNTEMCEDVDQTSDGGFILSCWTGTQTFGGDDALLIRTNANGDTLWTRQYGQSGGDFPYSVYQANDGGFVTTGERYDLPMGEYQIFIIKTDTLGNSGCQEKRCAPTITSPNMIRQHLNVVVGSGTATGTITLQQSSSCSETTLCTNVGIEESYLNAMQFMAYPVPSCTAVTIASFSSTIETTCLLYNQLGEQVSATIINEGNAFTVQHGNLPAGMYTAVISNENESIASLTLLFAD